MSNLSKFDLIYRSAILSKFFVGGWAKPEANLSKLFELKKFITDKVECNTLVGDKGYPIIIDKERIVGHYKIYDCHFKSPFAYHFPEFVPEPIETAKFQMILPKHWKHPHLKPMVVQLAGTGDHYFWRRRELIAKPLAKNFGIGSILLENPFYGYRKPVNQKRSSLRNVTDLFIMGGCLVMESMALLDWCEKQQFGPLALTGISMGGHMCSLAACNYNKPVALVPCLSWSTASGVFTQGAMARGVAWPLLQRQYFSPEFQQSETPIISALHKNQKSDMFMLGREFVQKYSDNTNIVINNDVQTAGDVGVMKKKMMFDFDKIVIDIIKPIFDRLSFVKASKSSKTIVTTDAEVVDFMRGVMDQFTHLAYFSKPVDPSLIIVVTARKDAYVPREGTVGLSELWPEAEFRYIENKGHIGAFLLEQGMFRKAIVDALEKTAHKYYKSTLRNPEVLKP